jgi:hypothetical protein
MSITLQIDLGLLDSLVVNQTRAFLKTKCLPVLDGTFVDAVDVRSSTYDIQSNSVTYAVTTQVMIVAQAALDASIGFSGGADADVFTFVINLSLTAGLSSTDDLELALTCTSDDSIEGAVLLPVKHQKNLATYYRVSQVQNYCY